MLIFRKEKMLARIEREGLMHLVGPTEQAAMDLLDGREVKPNLWRQTVHQEDAWYCTTADGEQFPVNPDDCDDVAENAALES